MEIILQITKAPIAKIWHVLKAKAIAALEKYVSVSTFAHALNLTNHMKMKLHVNRKKAEDR